MGGIPNIGPGMRLEHDAWALTRSLGAPGAFAPRFSAAGVRRRRPPILLVAAVMNVSKEATAGVSLPFVLVSLPVRNDNGLHLFSRWESRRMRRWRARRRKEGAAERCPGVKMAALSLNTMQFTVCTLYRSVCACMCAPQCLHSFGYFGPCSGC